MKHLMAILTLLTLAAGMMGERPSGMVSRTNITRTN